MESKSKITNYDSIMEDYIAHVEKPDSWNNLYERPYMLSQFPSFQDKHVLDLGCGSGFYTEYALKEGAFVTAIDASQLLINRLAQNIKSNQLRAICADLANPLTFLHADEFDYTICSLVIHYIEDWDPLLAEMYRVLKPKGKLFISTHHPYLVFHHPLLKGIDYFDTFLVEDTFGEEDHPFNVKYFTRSLTDILMPIINSRFRIVNVEEPRPNERCKQLSPAVYEKLLKMPGFIFITLEK